MANKIARVCTYPLCKRINCDNPAHQRQAQRVYVRKPDARPSASRRGYDATWRAKRKAFLAQHPYCEDCGAPSTDADHIPDRVDLVAQGVEDPDDNKYLHARCHSCHSKKTNKKLWRRGRGYKSLE